jgi:hypothetical protein
MPIDKQTLVRTNLDTLYSTALFDLDAAPVMITLPEAGKRYRAIMRFYDPDKPLFDRTWKLQDIDRVSAL